MSAPQSVQASLLRLGWAWRGRGRGRRSGRGSGRRSCGGRGRGGGRGRNCWRGCGALGGLGPGNLGRHGEQRSCHRLAVLAVAGTATATACEEDGDQPDGGQREDRSGGGHRRRPVGAILKLARGYEWRFLACLKRGDVEFAHFWLASPAPAARGHGHAQRGLGLRGDYHQFRDRDFAAAVAIVGRQLKRDRLCAVVTRGQVIARQPRAGKQLPTRHGRPETEGDGRRGGSASGGTERLRSGAHERGVVALSRFLREVLQHTGELRGGLEALLRVFLHAPRDSLDHGRVEAEQGIERHRGLTVHPKQLSHLAHERRPPGEHVVDGDAQRVDVGAMIDAPLDALGRGVRQRADECAGARDGGGAGLTGDPEIQHLDGAVVRNHDVVRLDVAVDDPARLGLLERSRDLTADSKRLGRPQRSGANEIAQRAPFHQLHHEEVLPVFDAIVEQVNGVRGPQEGDDVRLALEALSERLVGLKVLVQQLQRHARTVARVGRLIDDAHPAASKDPVEAIVRHHARSVPSGNDHRSAAHHRDCTASNVASSQLREHRGEPSPAAASHRGSVSPESDVRPGGMIASPAM